MPACEKARDPGRSTLPASCAWAAARASRADPHGRRHGSSFHVPGSEFVFGVLLSVR
jgi:hypothetical protein